MKCLHGLFLVCVIVTLSTVTKGQNAVQDTAQKESPAATAAKEEKVKGEVELLLEELKKRNEGVLGHCIEKL